MRRYFAEFLAAFFLVFAGVGAIVADQQLAVVQVRDSFGPLGIALAHGLALAVAIAAVARISGGHANPAVSLAFFVTGRISAKDLGGYVFGQLLGGTAAALLVKRLFLAQAVDQAGVGAVALQSPLNVFQGIAIEIVLTFFLVLVIWGVAVDRRGPKNLAPFAIGLTVTMDILVGGAFTGAAMNPARWFGPALAAGQFRNAAVWIVGPLVGALLAALLYESFFLTESEEEAEETEEAGRSPVPALAPTSASEWRDTPSPMVPPSGVPKPEGEPSRLTPPPPAADAADKVEAPEKLEPPAPPPVPPSSSEAPGPAEQPPAASPETGDSSSSGQPGASVPAAPPGGDVPLPPPPPTPPPPPEPPANGGLREEGGPL